MELEIAHESECPGKDHPLCECGLNTCEKLNDRLIEQDALIDKIIRMAVRETDNPFAGRVLQEIAKVGMGEKCSG